MEFPWMYVIVLGSSLVISTVLFIYFRYSRRRHQSNVTLPIRIFALDVSSTLQNNEDLPPSYQSVESPPPAYESIRKV